MNEAFYILNNGFFKHSGVISAKHLSSDHHIQQVYEELRQQSRAPKIFEVCRRILLDRIGVRNIQYIMGEFKVSTPEKGLLNHTKTKFSCAGSIPEPEPSAANKGVFKMDWASLHQTTKRWIRNPLNMVLFLWILCVAVSGAIIFLVMTGMLNAALPQKSERNTWFEVNNQILNALFTLMCLYQHPKRFYHLVLLCRWSRNDITHLRNVFSKNGTYKPQERFHITLVILLLHLNCFAQYALCGLNLGFRRSDRPAVGVGICLAVAIASAAVASLYSILSPLGRDYDIEVDEEAPDRSLNERRLSFALENVVEHKPQWSGGLLDIWEDISLAYLSLFCSCCLFGWNMERLGFGNMYVHMATFILICMSPFWIFNLAANNLDNETLREALGITGIMLCVFGLLYGGFWRIQMRKRFNLPANESCCGQPALADCAQWLFCCWCSLAQEVRTADFYEIREDKFCIKMEESASQISPLPREREVGLSRFRMEDNPSSLRFSNDQFSASTMSPPVPLAIHERR